MGLVNKSVYDKPEDLPEDRRYEFWPQFLQISPSYQLAHEIWCGRANIDQIPAHVNDFDLVLETYEHFGDVFNRSNRTWWKEVAGTLFAPKIAGLNWKVHKVWQLGEEVDQEELNRVMKDYGTITRPNLGSPLTLLASIPLDMRYEDILNSLRSAFRYYRGSRQDMPNYISPQSLYEIGSEIAELSKLELMLDLVHAIANKKDSEKQYQIGFRIGVNNSLRRVHTNANSLNSDERTRIGVRTNKLLNVALTAAENAARGRFFDSIPSDKHIEELNFHYLRNLPKQTPEDDELFAA